MAKVLYVNSEGYTGLAYHDYLLCEALQVSGHDVTLLTCREFPLWSLPRSFRSVPYFRGKGASKTRMGMKYAWAMLGLVPFALKQKPDIIHFEVLRIPVFDIPVICLLRLLGFPVVLHVHDVTPLEPNLIRMLGFKQSYRVVNHLTTYTEAGKDELTSKYGLDDRRVTVLTHGHYCGFVSNNNVDVEAARAALGLHADDRIILFFGVLRQSKGVDVLLKAMPHILEREPKAKLLVAGKARWEKELDAYKQLITHLRIADSVFLKTTFIPDEEVESIFAASDVVALPYRKAYYSGVIKLAYSHRKAVVASKLGGLMELLENGKTGYFVKHDDPDDLAEKILLLLNNAELRRQMGNAGRLWVESEFSWVKTALQLSQVYKRFTQH